MLRPPPPSIKSVLGQTIGGMTCPASLADATHAGLQDADIRPRCGHQGHCCSVQIGNLCQKIRLIGPDLGLGITVRRLAILGPGRKLVQTRASVRRNLDGKRLLMRETPAKF